MTGRSQSVGDGQRVARPEGYEPPKVEQVLTPTELEHEILYAGVATQDV